MTYNEKVERGLNRIADGYTRALGALTAGAPRESVLRIYDKFYELDGVLFHAQVTTSVREGVTKSRWETLMSVLSDAKQAQLRPEGPVQ